MLDRIYDLRQKEIINVKDGCRFGYLCDLEIDITCGRIVALIVPAPGKILGLFCREKEYRIPWDCIKKIGTDIILVDVEVAKISFDCN